MSTGLNVLLEAAQYIEHQEKLKRSPITASNDTVELCYAGQCSTGFDIASGVNGNNKNIINTRAVRNTTDLCQQVSSSAPAASARFHHVANGVIITSNNNNNSLNGNQLVVETKIIHPKQNNKRDVTDYEFTNRSVGGAITNLKSSPRVSHSSLFPAIATHDDSVTEAGIPANKSILNNGDDGEMIFEEGNIMNCIGGSQSPSRQSTTGSHYLQMMSAQQAAVASQMMHATPAIGSSGRRRTISSNSNGAGTREVHNKLEKNRRAHLKECYEQLKNQLPLKEDERKKTSNLAILGEAIKYVKTLKKKDQELEAEVEQLAKTKINSQLKLVSLKRELGPKYEQMFPGPFLDFDINNCEKEHLNETTSLSSGRGSILYSSSSSLSSGGSNGSTTMSSPVGASMSLPTALSPVISKTYINSNISSSSGNVSNNNSSNISMTSRSIGVLEHNQHQIKTSSLLDNTSPTSMLPANTTLALANGSVVNVNNAALSLTAKNISAMSLTRDSPTPSTPSPSPSSSSCVSSTSSLISSSPPRALNGIVNGRSVTVSIPNNIKISGNNGIGVSKVANTGPCATIGNGTSSAAATIIATSAPSNSVNSSNNAIMLQALRGCHLV